MCSKRRAVRAGFALSARPPTGRLGRSGGRRSLTPDGGSRCSGVAAFFGRAAPAWTWLRGRYGARSLVWRVGATLAGWLLQAEKTVVTTLHITLPDDPGKVAGGGGRRESRSGCRPGGRSKGCSRLASAMPKGKRGVAARADGRGKVGVVAGWLPEALKELDGIDEEIEEDRLPPVDDEARSAARRALRALAHQPLAPNVYPTPDGEISLSFKASPNPGGGSCPLRQSG